MTNNELNTAIDNIKKAVKYPELFENISTSERVLSGFAGTYLMLKGISKIFKHPVLGLTGTALGTGLLYRALTGYCPIKDLKHQPKIENIVVTETYVVEE
jgi:uncharacterized membrane protein